jgi:hypothetical protein
MTIRERIVYIRGAARMGRVRQGEVYKTPEAMEAESMNVDWIKVTMGW